jgi:hypothetical protein
MGDAFFRWLAEVLSGTIRFCWIRWMPGQPSHVCCSITRRRARIQSWKVVFPLPRVERRRLRRYRQLGPSARMAVISLDFSSTAFWPSTSRLVAPSTLPSCAASRHRAPASSLRRVRLKAIVNHGTLSCFAPQGQRENLTTLLTARMRQLVRGPHSGT